MDLLSLEEQQAYFESCMDSRLATSIKLKIQDTTPIFGEYGCVYFLQSEFEQMYPIFSRRVNFHSLRQQRGQSRTDWINKLQEAGAQSLIHEMSADDIYVMTILQNTCDTKFRDEIFKLVDPKLEEVIQLAQRMEIADNSVAAASGHMQRTYRVDSHKKEKGKNPYVKSTPSYKKSPANSNSGEKCTSCGANHPRHKCPHKRQQCEKCKKYGHLAQMCRSNNKKLEKSRIPTNPRKRTDYFISPLKFTPKHLQTPQESVLK